MKLQTPMIQPSRRKPLCILLLLAAFFFVMMLPPSSVEADGPNIPYALPVKVPPPRKSPSVNKAAPYTPLVLDLIAQLEPNGTLTSEQATNLAVILHYGASPDCHNV